MVSQALNRRKRWNADRSAVEAGLKEELERLVDDLGYGRELKIKWIPDGSDMLEGEVKGDVVYIYTSDEGRVVDTLLDEYFDYLVSKAIKPYEKAALLYRTMLMAVIKQVGEEAYQEKEKVVEALKKAYIAYRWGAKPSS